MREGPDQPPNRDSPSIGATTMFNPPQPYLPPELLDHIFGFLYYYRPMLGLCCIISKSWIPHVRKHLFSFVSLNTPAHLERWKQSFPDNSCTPAHYTRTLVIGCLEAATDADVGEGGWIRMFSCVTRLVLNNISACFNYPTVSLTPFHGFSPVLKSLRVFSAGFLKNSQILDLVSTLPQLEDLSVTSTEGDVDPPDPDMLLTITWQPSHQFTGTLDLAVSRGVDTVTHWLLSQPNGLHCHRSSFMPLLFTIPRRFSPTLLSLFLTTLLTTHAYGKGENNKTCIGTRRTTRKTTLVGLRTRVGIPGHLLPVPLLDNLRIDQVSPAVQLPCKVIRGNPTHVGVPLRTDQQVQHHMDRRWRTLSQLEAATWRTRGRNGSRTGVRVKTTNLTILGFAPG